MSTFQQTNLVSVKIFVALLSFALSANILGGCKNSVGVNNNDGENPDSIDAKFVWRICNESDEYAMENVMYGYYGPDSALGTLLPGKCSEYFPGPLMGNYPLDQVKYEQNGKEYYQIYLLTYSAVRGLIDSSIVGKTPGRYTYYFNYDTTRHFTRWVEIAREAYH